MKRDISIQIVRICAMFSIILCHIVQEADNKLIVMTGQFFNIGVYIFLIISGFLYSNKKIEPKKFYKDRFLKIMIPIYIFLIPIFIIQMSKGTFNIFKLLIYLFNLQGIFGGIDGASHLWFITAIGICYLLLPIFQFIKKEKKLSLIFNIMLFGITIVFCFINRTLGMIFICISTYSFGYFYFGLFYNNKKSCKLLICVFLINISIRVLFKYLFDETVLYDLILVGITQNICSICIIQLIKHIDINNIKYKMIINIVDKYSFYIYITHYFFMKGSASVMTLTPSFICNIFIMIVLSVSYAYILYYSNKFVYKRITRRGKMFININNLNKFFVVFLCVIYKLLLATDIFNTNSIYIYLLILLFFLLALLSIINKKIYKNDFLKLCFFVILGFISIFKIESVNYIFPIVIAGVYYDKDNKSNSIDLLIKNL